MLIEALKPNKTDALAYINGTSGPPERWARVIVVEGEGAPGDVEQAVYYMVFLPVWLSGKFWLTHPTGWPITAE
jgi:hypothetical protein